MTHRTRKTWLVLAYICFLLDSNKCDATLMEIAIAMKLNYATVRGIINRMEKKDYITIIRYEDKLCEDGVSIRPHALVSMKSHSKELWLLFEWLNGKFNDGKELVI